MPSGSERAGDRGGAERGSTNREESALAKSATDAQAVRSHRLEGRRIGLICDSRLAPAAALFIEAAEGLGAQVAVLHAADVMDAGAAQQDKLVRMLSRLYDVIECQDLPSSAVRHIAELVAVPVLANLGARALEQDDDQAPARGTPAWEQGLARVRQALLSAL